MPFRSDEALRQPVAKIGGRAPQRMHQRGFVRRALAGVLSTAVVATGSLVALPQASARQSGPTVTVGAITGASGSTSVPVTLSGFEGASSVVAVVSLPTDSGSLTIDPGALNITREFGYDSWTGRRSIVFRGSLADVTTALASGLSWSAPLHASPVALTVSVSTPSARSSTRRTATTTSR